jgi:hypothetical protein
MSRRHTLDQGNDKNWQDLCQVATTEQDPKKLMSLLAEIIKALDRKRMAAPPVVSRKDL